MIEIDIMKLIGEEKVRALALLEKDKSVIHLTRDLKVSRQVIYDLKNTDKPLPHPHGKEANVKWCLIYWLLQLHNKKDGFRPA